MFTDRNPLDSPVTDIIRPAKEYETTYVARRSRLVQQQPRRKGVIWNQFQQCIELTDLCRQAALELAHTYPKVLEYKDIGNEGLLKRTDKFFSDLNKNCRATDQQQAYLDRNYQVALRLYRELLIASHNPEIQEKSIGEWLAENIQACDDFEEVSIKQQFSLIHYACEVTKSSIRTANLICDVSVLWEGLLYTQIFRAVGGSLDRQISKDFVGKSLRFIASFIPVVQGAVNFLDFLESFEKLRELDAIPDIVDQAEKLDDYLNTYQKVCSEWMRLSQSIQGEMVSALARIEIDSNLGGPQSI